MSEHPERWQQRRAKSFARIAPAVVLVRRSRRHLAVPAEEAMRKDPRSPVVYLGSFNSDERVGRVGLGGYGVFVFLWPAAFYAIAKEWRGSSEAIRRIP